MIPVNTWDETKRRRNLNDHGVDFADLEDFFGGDLLTREDQREAYEERRYQSVGMFNGVALFVVWTPRRRRRHCSSHFGQKGRKS